MAKKYTELNKNITKKHFLQADEPYKGTAGVDETSISKRTDLGGATLEEFKKQTGTGASVIDKSKLQDKDYFQGIIQEKERVAEDIQAHNQSTLDKVGNGLVKFGGRVFTSLAGSTIGTLYGLAAWAKSGEFKSFYDNEFQDGLDGINDYLAEEFKHHYTSDPNDWEIGNFVFDKVFDGLGFATGAVLSGMTGAGVVGKLGKGIKFTKALKAGAVKELKELSVKGASKSAIRQATLKVDKLDKIGRNLAQIPQTLVGMTTGAVYESGVEARHSYDAIREELIEGLITSKSEGGIKYVPSDSELKNINQIAGESANGIFAANMALVGSSNFLQFGRHLGLNFNQTKRLLGTKSIAKEAKKRGVEVAEQFTKKGSAKIRGIAAATKRPIVESQEEMLQSVISGTGEEYARRKYTDDRTDLTDLLDASLKSFKKTYTSGEGWEEGLIGAIVGGIGVVGPKTKTSGKKGVGLLGGVYEGVKDFRTDEATRDAVVQVLNEKGSISSLKTSAIHLTRDKQLEEAKDAAQDLDSQLDYENAKNEQLISYIDARYQAGMIDTVYDDLQELRNKPLEDFKDAFGIPAEAEYTESDRAREVDSLLRQTKAIEENFKFTENLYPDISSDNQRALAFNKSTFERNEERKESIAKKIDELTGGHFTANSTPINQLDKEGKRLSKAEVFKGVPYAKRTFNSKVYEALYDDYIALEDNQTDLANEWKLLTTKDGQVSLDKKVETAQKEATKDIVDAEIQKENGTRQAEKEAELTEKAELEKEIEALNALGETTTPVTEDTEATAPMSNLDANTAAENVAKVKSIDEIDDLTAFIKQVEDSYDNIPKTLQKAIDIKKKQLAKLNKDNKGKVAKIESKHNINDGIEDAPPIDITDKDNKNLVDEINTSNQGAKSEGINNEDLQTESKGVQRLGGLLINAFNSVAVKTRSFKETGIGIVNDNDELPITVNTDLLSDNELGEGSEISIKLFTDDTFVTDSTDAEGNPKTIKNTFDENQIMEVYYKDNIVGYIHADTYITPERVVAEYPIGVNNIDANKRALSRFREKAYNHLQNNETMTVKVVSKTPGYILVKADGKYDAKLKDVFGKDKRPQILTVKASGLYLGNTHIENTKLQGNVVNSFDNEFYETYKGATVVAVPSATKVNGETQFILSLVRNGALSGATVNNKPVVPIISEILNAYITNESEVFDKYGIRNTPKAIEEYLANFMYITSDSTSKHYLYIGTHEKTGDRTVRFAQGGSNVVLNERSNGNLSTRLNESLVSTNLNKLNTIVNKGKKATIKTDDKAVNYMDFILDNLYANFIGHDITTSSGESRTYVANPIVTFEAEERITPTERSGLFTEEFTAQEAKEEAAETNSVLKFGKKKRRGPRKSAVRGLVTRTDLTEGMGTILDKDGNILETQQTHDIVESLKTIVHGVITENLAAIEAGETKTKTTVNEVFTDLNRDLKELQNTYEEASKQEGEITIEGVTNAEHAAKIADTYTVVLDNFETFKQLTLASLASINFVPSNQTLVDAVVSDTDQEEIITNAEEEHLEGGEANVAKTSYDEGANFLRNPIDSLSAQVKMLLSSIPKGKDNLLNLDSFHSLDTVYGALLDVLSNSVTDTIEDVIKTLQLHSIEKPFLEDVVYMIQEELSTEDLNKFHQNIRNNYLEHEIVVREVVAGVETFKVIKANRNSVSSLLVDDWLDNTNKAKVFKSEEGEVVVDEEYVADVLVGTKWKKVVDSKYSVDTTKDFLEAMGIRMSVDALSYIQENSKSIPGFNRQTWEQLFTTEYGVFNTLKTAFEGNQVKEVNPLKTERYVRTLALVEARFTENLNTSSFRNAEGKTIFSYINPTWLVDRFHNFVDKDGQVNLTKVREALSLPYASESTWLKALERQDEAFVKNFGVSVVDTLRTKGENATKFSSLSAREQTVATINLFINRQQGKDAESRIGKFIVAKSDKHVLHIISAIKHNTTSTDADILAGKFSEEDKDALMNLVKGEYARVIDAQKKRREGVDFSHFDYKVDKDTGEVTQGYNPFMIYAFPKLNDVEAIHNEDGSLKPWNNEDISDAVWATIKEAVIEEEIKTKAELTKAEVIKNGKLNHIDNNYINEHTNSPDYFVRDYIINNMIANSEYQVMFQGDIATAFKKDVDGTYSNMHKRLAKDIAPAARAAKHQGSKFNTYNQIMLKDAVNSSLNIEQLKDIYGKESPVIKEYLKITSTDAQEVTTLEEHVEVMYHYGKMTDAQYNSIIKKARKGTKLSEADLAVVLQPMKPVYVGNQFMSEYGVDMPVYIKTSSFPLIPELIAGTEFEKLERVMRKNKVSRATFESGIKLGGYRIIDGWNKHAENENLTDGTFNEKAIEDAIKDGAFLTLNRDHFGIQQDVPYDENKDKILEGSQIMKLIQAGIQSDEDKDSKEKIKEFNDLHNSLVEEGYQDLLTKIGFAENKDGDKYTATKANRPLEKLHSMLLAELMERGSYNTNDIKSLDLNADGTDFKMPIWTSPKAVQFEALLNSVISKKVLRQKLPGKSYVLGTEEGWLGNSSEITKVTSGLKGTRYDSKTGLKPQRKGYVEIATGKKVEESDKKDGVKYEEVVFPAQVLITNPKGLKQNQVIGYRIPSQDLNSMSAMEVVGYLPNYMADLVIAPKDFVIQMGSDFDIDKLYIHRRHETFKGKIITEESIASEWAAKLKADDTAYETIINNYLLDENINEATLDALDKEERFVKARTKQATQNKILDIYWDTLTDTRNLARIVKPLDFGDLPRVAAAIKEIQPDVKHHPLSPIYQMKNYKNGNAGKFGVAVTSIASTTNALIQAASHDVGSFNPLAFNINGENVLVSSFNNSDKTLDGNKTKADVISAFQSASVDNIKELLIETINYNKHTHNAFVALAYLGLDEEYISYMLAQPAIKEFVEKVDSYRDGLAILPVFDAVKYAYDDVQETHKARAIKENLLPADRESEEYVTQLEGLLEAAAQPKSTKGLLKDLHANNPLTQITLLHKFMELSDLGKEIGKVARALQPATSGVGKDRQAANKKLTDSNEIIENNVAIVGADALLGHTSVIENKQTKKKELVTDANGNPILTPTTIAGKGLDILRRSNNLWNQFFDIYTVVDRLSGNIAFNRGADKSTFTEKELTGFTAFVKSYIYSSDMNMYFKEGVVEARERLFFGKDSIAARWDAFKKENPENWLANRIITKQSVSSTKPSTISYQAAQAGRTDDLNNTSALIEMLYSNNKETVELAQDTIAYTYLRGGVQDAHSLLKFIPNTYLHITKLGYNVNSATHDLIQGNNQGNALAAMYKQYLQHKPYHAASITGEGDYILEEKRYLVKQKFYPKFISRKDGIWKLYERTSAKKDGYTIYKEIDRLGSVEFQETQYGNIDAGSNMVVNRVDKTPIVKEVSSAVLETPNATDTKVKNTEKDINRTATKYNMNKGTANQVVAALINKGKLDEGTTTLARAMMPHLTGVEIKLGNTVEAHNANGTYMNNVITIDNNLIDESEFARVVLHEALHAVLSETIENPTTDAQKKIINSLKAVLAVAKKNKAKFKHTEGLGDIHEFVSELMTDAQFQKDLKGVDFNKDKSLFDRIVELLSDLISAVTGTQVTNAAMDNVLTLITEVAPKSSTISKATEEQINAAYDADLAARIERDTEGDELFQLSKVRGTVDKYFTDGTTDSVTALNDISKSDHVLAPLAKKLIPHAKANNITIYSIGKLAPTNISKNPAGLYHGNTISINNNIATETTIIHEILHSLSHKQLVENPDKGFEVMFEKAKEVLGTSHYALNNIDEFLVGIFTDSDFIRALQEVEAVQGLKEHKNLMEQILDMILGKLGIFKSNSTLYSQAFATATNVLEGQRQQAITASALQKEYDKAMAFSLKNDIFEIPTEEELQEMRKNCK
jgi:hypothetical protein